MHDRTGWTRGATGEVKLMIKGREKTYKNLVEFKRPCASCGELFAIYVTPKIANEQADSNSFGLKNCEKHRRSSIRDVQPELEKLRMENNTMRAELKGVYARLAQYELAPAKKAAAARGMSHDFTPEVATGEPFPAPLTSKMPWE